KITESWFNTIMDRVTQRFAMHMRLYSIVLATAAVLATGIDTLHIVNVLKNDGTLRSGFVTTADALTKSETVDPKDKKTLQQLTSNVVAQLPDKQTLKPLLVPNANSGYLKPLFVPDAAYTIPGGLLSIILISLGAPFWFNALKDLVNLRSSVAK